MNKAVIWIVVFSVVVLIVTAAGAGYLLGVERSAIERCEALGAVAVQAAGDQYVCVEEVR